MDWNYILKLMIEIVLLLCLSYLIFYKSWLKSLGAEMAKLVTVKDLTHAQESIKSDFNLKLEQQKNKFNEELSLKIEPFKAELSKNNITHQVQFSVLHQERTKVIIEFYRKLVELQSSMVEWTTFMHPIVEDAEKEARDRAERANTAFNDFRNFYLTNKLFFSKSICETLDELVKNYWDKAWDYGFKEGMIKSGSVSGDFYTQYTKEMSSIREEIKTKIPIKILEIEEKFREILKVE